MVRASDKHRIVILGAGFAGMAVAQELARLLPNEDAGEIVLVDRDNYFLFTPMLTEVAGGDVAPRDIVSAIRSLAPRVTFDQASVQSIAATRAVTLCIGDAARGVPEVERTIDADQLVIALGSVTSYHDIPGLEAHSLPMKTLADAAEIRDRALALLERADEEPDGETRRALLTFMVGGGGTTGVETIAALNDLVRGSVERYHRIAPSDIRTILVEYGGCLLSEMSERLGRYAQRQLERRGVEVLLNTAVTAAGAGWVELAPRNGPKQRIAQHLLIWAGGITPNPVIDTLDVGRGRHRGIVVDECGQVPGRSGLWALGDCAEFPIPGTTRTYAPLAQNATREGTQVARNIVSVMQGRQAQPFVYHPMGELALVGSHSGVAQIYGFHISGFLAWAVWRIVYLLKLPRVQRRIQVAGSWLLDLMFGREMARD